MFWSEDSENSSASGHRQATHTEKIPGAATAKKIISNVFLF
jgi:hypothetical protein